MTARAPARTPRDVSATGRPSTACKEQPSSGDESLEPRRPCNLMPDKRPPLHGTAGVIQPAVALRTRATTRHLDIVSTRGMRSPTVRETSTPTSEDVEAEGSPQGASDPEQKIDGDQRIRRPRLLANVAIGQVDLTRRATAAYGGLPLHAPTEAGATVVHQSSHPSALRRDSEPWTDTEVPALAALVARATKPPRDGYGCGPDVATGAARIPLRTVPPTSVFIGPAGVRRPFVGTDSVGGRARVARDPRQATSIRKGAAAAGVRPRPCWTSRPRVAWNRLRRVSKPGSSSSLPWYP
jgi:hypothetical protein